MLKRVGDEIFIRDLDAFQDRFGLSNAEIAMCDEANGDEADGGWEPLVASVASDTLGSSTAPEESRRYITSDALCCTSRLRAAEVM